MAGRKFLTSINMALNEIKNMLLEIIAGDPGSPVEAQIWYNSTADKVKYRDGTATRTVATTEDALGGDLSGTVGNAQIAAGAIVNADVNGAAAIAYSKLNLAASIVNADIASSAAIALSKLATDPLARANHTGTQLASTISNFDTQVRTSRLDQMAAPTASVSMNSQRITNVTDPSGAQDAATKAYVDSISAGLVWKASCRVATTANLAALSGELSIDGVSTNAGDRVLVKDQSSPVNNGIYIVSAGAWSRASDADSSAELRSAAVFVEQGSVNANTGWVQTADNIALGVTGLAFAQFFGPNAYTAGDGLTQSGTTFNVVAGDGIIVTANAVAVDSTFVARNHAQNNTAGTSTTVTHNFNSRDVIVQVFEIATYETVEADVVRTTTNAVTVTFAASQSADTYRIVVIG